MCTGRYAVPAPPVEVSLICGVINNKTKYENKVFYSFPTTSGNVY